MSWLGQPAGAACSICVRQCSPGPRHATDEKRDYTSARLKTQGLHQWTHGKVEARLQLPRAAGAWPAFWMLGADVTGEWVFDHPFFIVLNLAVGGRWPDPPDATTPFPLRMVVDYGRVYQRG